MKCGTWSDDEVPLHEKQDKPGSTYDIQKLLNCPHVILKTTKTQNLRKAGKIVELHFI